MAVTEISENVRRSAIRTLKENIVTQIDKAGILSDEDIKNALISLTTIGWKQEDGFWRKL